MQGLYLINLKTGRSASLEPKELKSDSAASRNSWNTACLVGAAASNYCDNKHFLDLRSSNTQNDDDSQSDTNEYNQEESDEQDSSSSSSYNSSLDSTVSNGHQILFKQKKRAIKNQYPLVKHSEDSLAAKQ